MVTGNEGEYTSTLLPIGRYDVVVAHAGFKTFSAKGIALSVNDRLRVDIVLELGEVTQIIEVEAAIPDRVRIACSQHVWQCRAQPDARSRSELV